METVTPDEYHEEGNALKTRVQKQAIKLFTDQFPYQKVLFKCYTGFGKTAIGEGIIEHYAPEFIKGLDHVIVVCPAVVITNWTIVCHTHLKNRATYEVMTPQAYTIRETEEKWKSSLLIVDECHRILNKNSKFFSTALAITDCNRIALLSATVTDEHQAFLMKQGFKTTFHVSKLWGYKNYLVPEFSVVCIPVKLTPDETGDYLTYNNKAERYQKQLARGGITDVYTPADHPSVEIAAMELGWEVGAVINSIKQWRMAYIARNAVLYNAHNKKALMLRILSELKEQALVYCMSAVTADEIAEKSPTTLAFHSKLRKKQRDFAKESFLTGVTPHLISIGQLKEAIDHPTCRLAFRIGLNSTTKDTEQIGGRVIRLDPDNPDKEAYLICLYVQHIEAYGSQVISQDAVWLERSLAKEHKILYLKDMLAGLDFIKQITDA